MSRRADRRGSASFQLAALVDLLFVITFLLIWEREITMRKRVGKILATQQEVVAADRRLAQEAAQKAQEALQRADSANQSALSEQVKSQLAEIGELEKKLADSKKRETKLEEDLRAAYRAMLTGMRYRTQFTEKILPPR